MRVRMPAATVLSALAAAILLASLAAAAEAGAWVTVVVDKDGYTVVTIQYTCSNPAGCNVSLRDFGVRGEWDRVAVFRDNGEPVSVAGGNETITLGPGTYSIVLGSDSMVDKHRGMYYLHLSTEKPAHVYLPRNTTIVLNETSAHILYIRDARNGLVLALEPGNHTICYRVEGIGAPVPVEKEGSPANTLGQLTLFTTLSGVAGAAATYIALNHAQLIRRRRERRKERQVYQLDAREKMIVDTLRELGKASPQEIMQRTGIPRSALYRRLSRLLKYGIIEKETINGRVYYMLKEK